MQQGVVDFHRAMGQPVAHRAKALPADRIPVRVELIREEFIDELLPALGAGITDDGEIYLTGAEQDLVEVADACVDIIYVTLGLLTEMGIDAQVLFDEVQASNMSKLGADGKGIIAGPNDPDGVFEGRVKKGPNYFRPRLRDLLEHGSADLDVAGPEMLAAALKRREDEKHQATLERLRSA
jgi:Uncharacterized protein conserved in bacteria